MSQAAQIPTVAEGRVWVWREGVGHKDARRTVCSLQPALLQYRPSAYCVIITFVEGFPGIR